MFNVGDYWQNSEITNKVAQVAKVTNTNTGRIVHFAWYKLNPRGQTKINMDSFTTVFINKENMADWRKAYD